MFLGFLNLADKNILMAVIAGALQYWQSRMMLSKNPVAANDSTSKMMQYQTLYFLPAITVIFGSTFPAGLTLYWIVTTVFGVGQQYYILRKEARKVLDAS
jgi:YidC/Oxa1 family membrane protein insertase